MRGKILEDGRTLTLILLWVWVSSFLAISIPLRIAQAKNSESGTFAIVLTLVTAARVTTRLLPKLALTSTMEPNEYGEGIPAELVVSSGVTPPRILFPEGVSHMKNRGRPQAGLGQVELSRVYEHRLERPPHEERVYTFQVNRVYSGTSEEVEVRITVLFE